MIGILAIIAHKADCVHNYRHLNSITRCCDSGGKAALAIRGIGVMGLQIFAWLKHS